MKKVKSGEVREIYADEVIYYIYINNLAEDEIYDLILAWCEKRIKNHTPLIKKFDNK